MGCIYTVINLLTGKQYIGGTVHSAKSRWNSHIREAKSISQGVKAQSIHSYELSTNTAQILLKSELYIEAFLKRCWVNWNSNTFPSLIPCILMATI